MRTFFLLLFLPVSLLAQKFTSKELARWKKQSKEVTIIRDTWGIAHVYGKTDADAVFGMLYAQCEDDFPRVEMNYITAVARLAEVEGEAKLFHDLRMRLFYDTLEAAANYQNAEPWLKSLCDAFAAGVNYYLYTHPEVKPKLLTRFQPWMPFLFSEGSIGGDIETISTSRLKEFYGEGKSSSKDEVDLDNGAGEGPEPRGSNGFAIAPSRTANGHALLMINPHTSFYFRPEIHVNSEEGLHVYGAVTWGQFFVYQGFNEHCGWMHTSSQADAIDEYKETLVEKDGVHFYKYGSEEKRVQTKSISVTVKEGSKKVKRQFTVYYTHHGPVIAKDGAQWISIRLMKEPVKALTQSYQRTRATSFDQFKKTMDLRTNSSNNTVYADAEGNIAYWHGNFIPKRNPQFDWSRPVDGSNPATEWGELHSVAETVHQYNPSNGWIQNCNSTPFTVSGTQSPKATEFPKYMAPDPENPRGLNAVRVMDREKFFDLDKLIRAAYDPYLIGFKDLIPSLIAACETTGANDLNDQLNTIKEWDLKCSSASVATTLAIYWGQELRQQVFATLAPASGQLDIIQAMVGSTTTQKVDAFRKVVDELQRDFGTWRVAWGEVNRFQRLTGQINESYDDAKPSIAVPFTSSFWGSLAAFGSRKASGAKKMYGYVGNSFVAAVEFGPRIKAKSVLAGGVNNSPSSPYFINQASDYAQARFKDVLFYRDDVAKSVVRQYHPGSN